MNINKAHNTLRTDLVSQKNSTNYLLNFLVFTDQHLIPTGVSLNWPKTICCIRIQESICCMMIFQCTIILWEECWERWVIFWNLISMSSYNFDHREETRYHITRSCHSIETLLITQAPLKIRIVANILCWLETFFLYSYVSTIFKNI